MMRYIPQKDPTVDTGFKDDDAKVARWNPQAEVAYWMAFLGFVPVIGIPFAFLSFVGAINGLLRSRETPGHVGSTQGYVAYFVALAATLTQLVFGAWIISKLVGT